MDNPEDIDGQAEENDAQPQPEAADHPPEETEQPEESERLEEAENPVEGVDPEQIEESAERPVVFISHRQGFDLDQNIATMLYENLSEVCDVYLDTQQLPSTRWRELIKNSIKEADFVIALITENANRSDWVAFELGAAHRRWNQFESPVIIPVYLEPIEIYELNFGAYIDGFNRVDYKGNNEELITALRATIFGGGVPSSSTTPHGMEGFLVRDAQRDLMRAAFLESPKLEEASAQLQRDKLLWLVGDDSARNYVALSLAVKEQLGQGEAEAGQDRKIYEVTRSLSWSKVNRTTVRDAIIIFRDVSPSSLFDEEKHTNELESLKALVQRRNTIFLTTSADAYLEIQQEMRRQDFKMDQSVEIAHDFYDDSDKQFIFEKLLDFSKETQVINPRQYELARGLLDGSPMKVAAAVPGYSRNEGSVIFGSILKKWSPADIERFVTLHLRQVKKSNDIVSLLNRNANLDNEIHSWFISLDDSTRCFVMALALFNGLNTEQLWEKYKAIVESLRRLDVSLSLWPLGICRQRASLYVTAEGALDFKEERFADAVYREIAKNYREYFIELIPLMEKWSVPPGRKQRRAVVVPSERKRQAAEGADVRAAVARMVGKMSLNGFAKLSGLIDYWATDPLIQVREAVALSLEQAASESVGAKHTFNMLDKWCGERSTNEDALYKTWAAASALGNIAAANSGQPVYVKALDRLNKLARDGRGNIRFYLSIPLKKVARKVPLSEIENLLSLVVQDEQPGTRINIAEALNEARVFDKEAAGPVIERWLSCENDSQRWAAICSIILWRKQSDAERNQEEVVRFLDRDPATLADVFVETVKHKYHKTRIQSSFEKLVLQLPEDAREKLTSGLAEISFDRLDERLLGRFKSAGEPSLERLVFEVRGARWKHLLLTPRDFISDLREELNRERMTIESYAALALLQRPEPDGSRRRLICALVDGFAQNRAGLDKVLTKLKNIAPAVFEPLVVEVRHERFKQLFHDPAAFVEAVIADMSRTELSEETAKVLELLAQPEPAGYRDELLQALASSYGLDPAPVESLFSLFRNTSNHILRLIVFEFNYRLLEGLLSSPAQFLSKILSTMRNADEQEEAVQILSHLAVSEPQGKRRMLIQALAQAKGSQPQEVDYLLRHPSLQAWPNLASLRLEVRLASILNSAFVPDFVSRFFTPAR
jgi:hypothetical protein